MWTKFKSWLGFLYMALLAATMVWVVYECIFNAAFRRSFGLGMLSRLKWYIIWAIGSYIVSWLWKKFYPKEKTDDRPQVQESEPEGKRRRNKRHKRGR